MTRRLVLLFVLMAATAHAESAGRSYRKQTMIVDLSGIAAFTIGALGAGKPGWPGWVGGGLVAAGITTYFVGGPIVHGVNGNSVLRSVGLRITPLALAFVVTALAANCEGGHECGLDGVAEGATSLLVTVPAALLIDWLVFSEH
jgi:hypothetical protein